MVNEIEDNDSKKETLDDIPQSKGTSLFTTPGNNANNDSTNEHNSITNNNNQFNLIH